MTIYCTEDIVKHDFSIWTVQKQVQRTRGGVRCGTRAIKLACSKKFQRKEKVSPKVYVSPSRYTAVVGSLSLAGPFLEPIIFMSFYDDEMSPILLRSLITLWADQYRRNFHFSKPWSFLYVQYDSETSQETIEKKKKWISFFGLFKLGIPDTLHCVTRGALHKRWI